MPFRRGSRALRAVVLVHRHGDRCPTEPALRTASELEYWLSQVPSDAAVAKLEAHFPRAEPVDAADDAPPWGRLTNRGLAQMRERGERLRARLIAACGGVGASDDDGVIDAMVRDMVSGAAACSSKYERVQRSLQSLLAGLQASAGTTIRSTAADSAAINPWDTDHAMQELVFTSARKPDFILKEEAAAATRDELTAILPLFGGGGSTSSTDGEGASPLLTEEKKRSQADEKASFLWIRAADVFWTRNAHQLESPAEIGAAAIAHTLWRFNAWYMDEAILGRAVAPLLDRIVSSFDDAVGGVDDRGDVVAASPQLAAAPPQLAVFSGHDVTVLPLLHALGCDGETDRWPGYASSIALELWQSRNSSGSEWSVRVAYDDGREVGGEWALVSTLQLNDLRETAKRLRRAGFA